MRRIIVHTALMAGGALVLAGCGIADSRSPVPEFMRRQAVDPPPPEPPPDVRQLVLKNLDSVFVAASNPRHVRVAPPHHVAGGLGWTACVMAELISVTGRPLGAETYRITISNGAIIDRRRAETDDICGSESYEPISWSGFDIRYPPAASPTSECQIQNSTRKLYFASGPLILTFAKGAGLEGMRMLEPDH